MPVFDNCSGLTFTTLATAASGRAECAVSPRPQLKATDIDR
jgi:hypothetical protein